MINKTIILLTYYYQPELRNHRLMKYVGRYLGAYLPWDIYLYEPLRKIFSRVILYDYLQRMTEIGVKAVNEEITAMVAKERPGYVLWTSWRHDILEPTLEAIKQQGSTVIGWFFDDEWRFDDYSRWWVPYLDYCVTNALEAVPRYKELGARVIYTIPNTGLAFSRDWSKIEENYDVSFVGGIDVADREAYLNVLRRRNIPVHIVGTKSGGYVSFEDMIRIFQTSKINLNFSKDISRRMNLQIKGRVFQVCMAGGFMLTEYAPGLENYFEIGREIVCFHDTAEMIDKINYYLERDEERLAIARAGWQRATNEHSSSHMVAKVFREIEEDLTSREMDISPKPGLLKQRMSLWTRRHPSRYHFQWARTLLEENYKEIPWRDELKLSLSYSPFNMRAWYYYIVGLLPFSLRPLLWGIYGTASILLGTLVVNLSSIIRSMKKRT